MNELNRVVRECLVESPENLDQFDQDLVELAKHLPNPERPQSIFHTIHTIKGTAGFLELAWFGALADAGDAGRRAGRLRAAHGA